MDIRALGRKKGGHFFAASWNSCFLYRRIPKHLLILHDTLPDKPSPHYFISKGLKLSYEQEEDKTKSKNECAFAYTNYKTTKSTDAD